MLSRLARLVVPLVVLAAIGIVTIGSICTIPPICTPPITIG